MHDLIANRRRARQVNKTGYFFHPDCRRHEMGPGHPECPERLDSIEDRLLISGVMDALDRREAPLASASDLELAHDKMHVASIRGLADELADEIAAGGHRYARIDPDTAMNEVTWGASLRAAGAGGAAGGAGGAGGGAGAGGAGRPPGHH